jgi:hypothetical protein
MNWAQQEPRPTGEADLQELKVSSQILVNFNCLNVISSQDIYDRGP